MKTNTWKKLCIGGAIFSAFLGICNMIVVIIALATQTGVPRHIANLCALLLCIYATYQDIRSYKRWNNIEKQELALMSLTGINN